MGTHQSLSQPSSSPVHYWCEATCPNCASLLLLNTSLIDIIKCKNLQKFCLNCIQSPSITNSQMFYLWTHEVKMISAQNAFLWLRELSHFPSSMLRHHYLQITGEGEVISLSLPSLWGLCYRWWDVWLSRKWSEKILSPLSDGPQCVSCGELSVSKIV